jgi:hypothetical protein
MGMFAQLRKYDLPLFIFFGVIKKYRLICLLNISLVITKLGLIEPLKLHKKSSDPCSQPLFQGGIFSRVCLFIMILSV